MHEFDNEVAEELWEHTPKQSGDHVYVRDYIKKVLDGEAILREGME